MDPRRIYTRKTLGLDNRVWRLMIVMIFLSLGLLSYRLIKKEEECTEFTFTVTSLNENDVFYTNETLSFTASTTSEDIDWNFDDNSHEAGINVFHKFSNEGTYRITASGKSLCPQEKYITIQSLPIPVQPGIVKGKIEGPTSFYTFTAQKFTYKGEATSYVWSVQDHPIYGTESGKTVSFRFNEPDTYTIQVELDSNERKRDYFEVTVLEKPSTRIRDIDIVEPLIKTNPAPLETRDEVVLPPAPIPTPETPETKPFKPIAISPVTFKLYLEEVINKVKTVQDFEKYGVVASTPVTANGKRGKHFNWLCQELIKTKKVGLPPFKKTVSAKIEGHPVLHRNDNNIVTLIEVNYRYN